MSQRLEKNIGKISSHSLSTVIWPGATENVTAIGKENLGDIVASTIDPHLARALGEITAVYEDRMKNLEEKSSGLEKVSLKRRSTTKRPVA